MPKETVGRMKAHENAQKTWAEWRETKYSDGEIREQIGEAVSVDSLAYSELAAESAQAMIAYNEMIDKRIERAEKSWKAVA